MKRTAALLLLLAAPAWAAPPAVKLPAKVQVDSGGWIVVTAETDSGKPVKFWPLTRGMMPFPPELVSKPNVFVATAPDGVYLLLAWTGSGDGPSDGQVSEITVGKPTPPAPPAPSDPLWAPLKASFSGSAADKAGAARLAAGYRQVAGATARDAALKSVGDFRAAAGTVIGQALPMPGLQACRQVVANDVTPQFGTNPGLLLDTSLRDKFAAAFTRYATLFEALSQ